MPRPICPPEERIVRAICSPEHYDPEENRISPSLFKDEGTSVSRLQVIPLEDHWEMFRRRFERPGRKLSLIGEIGVGELQQIGRDYTIGPPHNRTPSPVELTVEEAPEEWNPAHAEIPQKITRGLANQIIPALTIRRMP